jgi:F-type H+-transporting ATPase subunit epsilon
MAEEFFMQIIRPSKLAFSGQVEMANLPGTEGVFGVLAGHAPLIAGLGQGIVSVIMNGGLEKKFFIYGGIANIASDGLTILSDFVIDLAGHSKSQILDKILELKDSIESEADLDPQLAHKMRDLEKYEALSSLI